MSLIWRGGFDELFGKVSFVAEVSEVRMLTRCRTGRECTGKGWGGLRSL